VGKTSLARALAGDLVEHVACNLYYDERSHCYRSEKIVYALSCSGRIALAGSVQSGSDSISRSETLRRLINLLFDSSDVIVVDAFRTSMSFVDWLQHHPKRGLGTIIVHIDIPEKINVDRLEGRRARRGQREANLPSRTYANLLSLRRRAERVWEYARASYKRTPNEFVIIGEGLTPEQAADRVWKAVAKISQTVSRKGKRHDGRSARKIC